MDQILREDPAGIYSKMDFESRDYYRNAIETIAKDCGVSETYIAKKTVECARRAVEEGKPYRRTHGLFLGQPWKKLFYQELGRGLGGNPRPHDVHPAHSTIHGYRHLWGSTSPAIPRQWI